VGIRRKDAAIFQNTIFADMAQKQKKTGSRTGKKSTTKGSAQGFKPETEERIDWKKIAKDERTWKIVGAVSLLASIVLFIAFISYFFTWKDDQTEVARGAGILLDADVKVNNLLGRLGAVISHFFIYKGFGIASLLICTFFFVVGTNLLVNKKVFSVTRNLKYVTLGMLVVYASVAFITSNEAY